jgi:hypothetical protein
MGSLLRDEIQMMLTNIVTPAHARIVRLDARLDAAKHVPTVRS